MPTYDYICLSCGYKIISVRRKMEDLDKEIVCPRCGEEMELLHSPVPFFFKGDGWGKRHDKD